MDCDYCSGTGEVPESSTRYMKCPKCGGTGEQERRRSQPPPAPAAPKQGSLFGTGTADAFDPRPRR